MAALALPSPTDPKTWHADTRDVFLIVGSKLSGVAQSGDKVAMSFLDEIRPFERARISGGLRDLLATAYTLLGNVKIIHAYNGYQ